MELSKFKILISIFLFLFFNQSILPQVYPDKEVDNLVKRGINKLLNQNYDSSKKIFSKLDDEYPSIPLGKIYLAAAYIAEAYDYAEEYDSDKIKSLLSAAIDQSNELKEKDPGNIWNTYFCALANGYYAYFQALLGDWLPALTDGLSSVSDFEDCVKMDSTFYEAYTAIGAYKYWKSRKTEFLNWLPFIDDEKESGIRFLEKAVQHSNYSYYLGVYSLQWIYIDKAEYNKAILVSQKALQVYPDSRFFKMGLARAYREVNLSKAVKIYYEILNSYPRNRKSNMYNEMFLKYVIAQCCQALGENDKGIKLCNEILSEKNLSPFVKEKFGNRMDKVQQLKKELSTRR